MVVTNATYQLVENTTSNSTAADDYDHVGAMHFIIATVLVYSTLGVFCTLVTRFKRSHDTRSYAAQIQDEHIQKYLKHQKYLKQDGFKMKLMFECGKTKGRLEEIGGRARLLDIQKAVTCPDFTTRSVSETRKQRKKMKRKTRLDSLMGKMGFSLIYVPENGMLNQEDLEIGNDDTSSVSDAPSHSADCTVEMTTLDGKHLNSLSVSQTCVYENETRSANYSPESVTLEQSSPHLLPVVQKCLYEDRFLPVIHNSYSSSDISQDEATGENDIPFKVYLEKTTFLENETPI